jgi:hypothetical protein
MGGRADGTGQAPVGEGTVEQAELELLGQDAAGGVVDPFGGDTSRLDGRPQQPDEAPVVVDLHHVHAGVDGGRHLGLGEALLAVDGVQADDVADHDAAEAELALEHVRDEVVVRVQAVAVPATGRDPHAGKAALDRGAERGQVDRPQVGLGGQRVARVDPVGGRAVPDEPGRGGQHRGRSAQGGALQPGHHRRHRVGDLRLLTERLRRPYPTVVAGHAQARPGAPVGARAGDLLGDGAADPLGQIGVARRAEADAGRKHGAVLAVSDGGADQDRDAQRGGQCRPLPLVGLERQGRGALDRADAVPGQVTDRVERGPVHPHHLADLVVERHARQQVLHARAHGRRGPGVGEAPGEQRRGRQYRGQEAGAGGHRGRSLRGRSKR